MYLSIVVEKLELIDYKGDKMKKIIIILVIFSFVFSSFNVFAEESLKPLPENEKETKSEFNISTISPYLEAGYYYIELENIGNIEKIVLIGENKETHEYYQPKNLKQRDIFPINTFTNEIIIDKNGVYHVYVYSKSKTTSNITINKYDKKTTALTSKDLSIWSASYTDDSIVSVTNNGAEYVNMAKYAPEIISFSQISTSLNRSGIPLDSEDIVVQRKDYADILIKVNEELMKSGYRLMIYDGYRSKNATSDLYEYTIADLNKPSGEREYPEINKDTLGWYVVNPMSVNDRHGKGTASDVTLVDMATGEVVNMPTRVNTMNRESWIDRTKANSKEYQLLYSAMKKYGGRPYSREWYHFSYVANKEFKAPTNELRSSFYPQDSNKPSAWATNIVNVMIGEDLISENLLKDYRRAITRAEFIDVIIKNYESKYKEIIINTDSFSDTLSDAVLKAKSVGIVSGVGNNRFMPNKPITREEVAVIIDNLVNTINDKQYIISHHEYDDGKSVSDWAKASVQAMNHYRLMIGVSDNQFAPKSNLKREEAIVLSNNISVFIEMEHLIL